MIAAAALPALAGVIARHQQLQAVLHHALIHQLAPSMHSKVPIQKMLKPPLTCCPKGSSMVIAGLTCRMLCVVCNLP
jgi:hypothetical protein